MSPHVHCHAIAISSVQWHVLICAHLGGDHRRGDGPDGRGGCAGGRPEDAVRLDAQVGGQEACLAVAAEHAELQVKVHLVAYTHIF